MQSYYSVYGTNITLLMDDTFAANYNRAQDAFVEAQKKHKERTGQNWTGRENLWIDWTDAEQKAFNEFADFMNSMIKMAGGSLDLKQEDMPSTHLEKLHSHEN